MIDILQYKGYYAEVHFSAEDEVFFGKLIGIGDLVTFESETVKGLKKNFAESVDDYLATCKTIGKSPEKTYKGSFNVRVPTDLHRKAAMFAAINKVTLNEFVRYALDYAITHQQDMNLVSRKHFGS